MNIGPFVRRFRAEPPVLPRGIDHEAVAETPVRLAVTERDEPIEVAAIDVAECPRVRP